MSKLALFTVFDFSAQYVSHDLQAVTDAQNRQTKRKDFLVGRGLPLLKTLATT